MKTPSASKTENRALNTLESLIDEHETMSYCFNSMDKEMSWDGYISLPKQTDKQESKENFEARIPVQIKGHNDPHEQYINKDRITWSVDIADLRAYSSEKGVLYFQIFINGKHREIFFTSLFPSKLADYIETAEKKNHKTKKIPFFKLEQTAQELYVVVKQFSDEGIHQGTAYTPLVIDRIRSEDFNKIQAINFTVVGSKSEYETLRRLSTGSVCIYGKMEGDKYFRPLEWRDETEFSFIKTVEQPILVDEELFYDKYRCVANSKGELIVYPSDNIELNLTEGKNTFHIKSGITDLCRDAKFSLKLLQGKSLFIGDMERPIKNPNMPIGMMQELKYLVELGDVLDMIGFYSDAPYNDYTALQLKQLQHLVDIRRGRYNSVIKDPICKFRWKFGEKDYPLLIAKSKDGLILRSAIYARDFAPFLPNENNANELGYKLPLFLFESAEIIGNLYIYDYATIEQQIAETQINEVTSSQLNLAALKLIAAYDVNQEEKMLEIADSLLDTIKPLLEYELYQLNKFQIKRRMHGLDNNDIETITNITSTDHRVMFGKSVLLGDLNGANDALSHFSEATVDEYRNYPIYKLYEELKS